MAERSDYADVQSFVRAVAGGALKDDTAPPVTYDAGKTRPWAVEYTRDGETLGIKIDLLDWVLQKRWTQEGVLGLASARVAFCPSEQCGRDFGW